MKNATPQLVRRATVLASLFAAATLLSACANVSTPVSLTDTIQKEASLSTLSSLVNTAGLNDSLRAAGPFTVFAPSNDAFKALPASALEDLRKHPEKLKDVLTYHVINGKALAASVKNGKAKTLSGADIELSKAGEFVTVENAAVTQADIVATNGVVHIIDTVLTPPKK
jgi:uncharacterized surface protein with fasciclin (FAS1) repeats